MADVNVARLAPCACFSNKVRAFLDYAKIQYRVIEVNPMTKEEKKLTPELASTKEVPVLMINRVVLTDSTQIIKHLNEIMNLYRAPKQKHEISPAEEVSGLAFSR
jgi:microsomal prostaglandin-E synthase 2